MTARHADVVAEINAAHHDGINLDLLAMRLDGDLGQTTEHRDGPR